MQPSEMEKFAKSWIGFGAMTLMSAVLCGFLESRIGSQEGVAVASIGMASAMLLLVIGIAIHEAGHLFVGLALGINCQSVLIGPCHWIREGEKWRFNLTNDARIGGFVSFDPYRSEVWKKKYIAMYAGGPAASLLFALLLTTIVLNIEFPDVFLWPFIKAISIGVLWLMAANFVPLRIGGFGTDGYWIWATITGNKQAQAMASLGRVIADTKDGKPTEEWDMEDVRTLSEIESPINLVVVARALLFWHAWANQDKALAREHIIESLLAIRKMKANIPGIRYTVFATAAFSAAMIDGDAEIVREFVGEIDYTPPQGRGLLTQIDSWLAKQEGSEDEAMELAERSVREIATAFPGKTTTIWSLVDSYRFIGDAEHALAVETAEELIGLQPVPPVMQSPETIDTSPTSMN